MTRFIQLHLLTAYPPANLNRDDLGRPKTSVVGGTERLRISSQSLKRAWRTSDVFESALAGHIGKRTKELGPKVRKKLVDGGVAEKKAVEWTKKIVEQFAKKFDSETLKTGQLVHYTPTEWSGALELADILVKEGRAPTDDEIDALRSQSKAVDLALFGRMLADYPGSNVDAAVQVAHAISVNSVRIEDDYFTAVDDLNTREDSGAAHIGEAGFGAGVFYLYLCIDRRLLQDNLQGDVELANTALRSLTEAAATVAPSGKQNSFGSRARTSYLLAECGEQQPRSLSVAFLNAMRDRDNGILDNAINAIERQKKNFDQVYGDCAESRCGFNVESGEGSLQAVLDFVAS
jgi:CRISPR system Cascade subunit CasC